MHSLVGQGTWNLGDSPDSRSAEIEAIRVGLDLGLTVIDTAESYGDGRSESLVREAIAGRRDDVFLVSKLLPSNASASGTIMSCHGSLKRLATDHLDLYLLHWRGGYPLDETVESLESLVAEGAIGAWGVSNFDERDLDDLPKPPACNQILYNLTRRGPELDLLPYCAANGIPVMAYSPIEQGRLLAHRDLRAVAAELDATPGQVALAWAIREGEITAIPKSSSAEHTRENAGALDIRLTDAALERLDRSFRRPPSPVPLEMI